MTLLAFAGSALCRHGFLSCLLYLLAPHLGVGGWQETESCPSSSAVDAFHPQRGDSDWSDARVYGGRITIHLATMPPSLNRVLVSSLALEGIWNAVHESLLHRAAESSKYEPRLCTEWYSEDALVLHGEVSPVPGSSPVEIVTEDRIVRLLHGEVVEKEESFEVRSRSFGSGDPEASTVVPKADVQGVERGSVFTFQLRNDVYWHDGHAFDAGDIVFTWRAYLNPGVKCGATRAVYNRIIRVDSPRPGVVRFFLGAQVFDALDRVARMPILPRHLYDLHDPDHAAFDPDATQEELARHINTNPHNLDWVGLGAYRVTSLDATKIEAERFPGYFGAGDSRIGGYLDAIRWRYVQGADAALQAALAGEFDLYTSLKSGDYFGEATESERFKRDFYKGTMETGLYGYACWNLLDPKFEDARVRKALAHAFDLESYVQTAYRGLGRVVTGPVHYFSPAYDHTIQPPSFDPERAEELLTSAGWYDRDGDGVIDRDGLDFEFEFLYPAGNTVSRDFGLQYQEALASQGIRVRLASLEWASFVERVSTRQFDAIHLAWAPLFEGDPEKRWHSRWANPEGGTSNYSSVADDEVDRLIEAIQVELDHDRRMALWHRFQARIAELQPCFFQINTPRKFMLNKRIRGLETYPFPPGYSVRRLHLAEGAPGTRSAFR